MNDSFYFKKGIKPVISAFVGDQFTAAQSHLLERVFRLFYFCINFGSFFSTLMTPVIRRYPFLFFSFSFFLFCFLCLFILLLFDD